jgi:ATPase family associated with various cellular activities (AAA)
MSEQESMDTKQFLNSFKDFMDQVVAQAPVEEPPFLRVLREHFATDPTDLPIIAEQFEKADHPNLHVALTYLLERAGWSFQLLGAIPDNDYIGVKMAHLLNKTRGSYVNEGPVEYINIPLGEQSVVACVQSGLYLIKHGERPLALLVRGPREMSNRTGLDVEVMALEQAEAETFLAELRTAMRQRNVYRSHAISLAREPFGSLHVNFHRLPPIARPDIILPKGVLDRIERQTISFARLSERLRAAGRHIKRGILLYGPPGTGKTLTAMYIAGQMTNRTVLLVTGRSAGLIEDTCKLARLLQPATVILEDVDLIAEERTRQESGCTVLLFELLNQMDGIAEDADILFILTTNRPDILEPALAARPGRIDQAIEIPLPDYESRQRLFDLYGKGLTLKLQNQAQILAQTEGVSATFIRELLRKAALFSADEHLTENSEELVVEDRHLDQALRELALEGGELTKRLLGASRAF